MSRTRADAPPLALYTLFVALLFGVQAWMFDRAAFDRAGQAWAAPLDDAYIHAQLARNAASGHPLAWLPGDGVSSVGTSVLWPLVLAVPWALGARGDLIVPAGRVVAVLLFAAGFAFLARPLARVHRAAPWLGAVVLACDGPVLWHGFSGMELPLVFASLAALVRATIDALDAEDTCPPLSLAIAGALAVLVRPEAMVLVSPCAALVAIRRVGNRDGGPVFYWKTAASALVPALAVTLAIACLYRATTGSFAASGALAKLVTTHPLLTAREMLDAFASNAVFALRRIVSRDETVDPLTRPLDTYFSLGAAAFALALLPGAGRRTSTALAFGLFVIAWAPTPLLAGARAQAAFGYAFAVPLAVTLVSRVRARVAALVPLAFFLGTVWALVAATNTQVVYHLDRYLMPARILWLLAATAGVLELCSGLRSGKPFGTLAAAVGAFALVTNHDALARWRTHFAQACANLREQHHAASEFVRTLEPPPTRVLLNDAGALPYFSGHPALDLVGLGGLRGLPWARAHRLGVGASLELLEHVAPADLPSHLAIYPGWFPGLAENFGTALAHFPVHGNVICGGPDLVVYGADWSPLTRGTAPSDPLLSVAVREDIDLGDPLAEARASVETSVPAPRDFRVFDASDGVRVFDAGPRLGGGEEVRFALPPGDPARLALRIGALLPSRVRVAQGEAIPDDRALDPRRTWHEWAVSLAPAAKGPVHISVVSGSILAAHAWTLNASPRR